jgi:branched-chain amino acid transport system permease protein
MTTQCGVYHETYASDMQVRPTIAQRARIALAIAAAVLVPFVANPIQMQWVNNVIIAAIGAIGLNILVGYAGQISLGQGAFLAVGAYASGLLMVYLSIPWWLSIILAAFITALVGGLFGLPSLRLKGLYLAVATLAAQQIIQWVIINWDPIDGAVDGRATDALNIPTSFLFGHPINHNEYAFYPVALVVFVLVIVAVTNLFRTHIGRAFIAIRDQDIAAEVMGVNLYRYKVLAFAISSFLVGLAGALIAQHSTAISFERFTIEVSIEYLAMIIIGGMGSIAGSTYGAAFIVMLPLLLNVAGRSIAGSAADTFARLLPFIQQGAFGIAIILFLIFEPGGIVKLWRNVKDYFRLWPFSY